MVLKVRIRNMKFLQNFHFFVSLVVELEGVKRKANINKVTKIIYIYI